MIDNNPDFEVLPIETFCFHSVVDILEEAKTEEQKVILGQRLLDQVPMMESDPWKEARCYYLAARAFRAAEFLRDKSASDEGYGEAVYSALVEASDRDHVKSMQWLQICYADGQSIITPSEEKADEMKLKISAFIKRVRKFHDAGWIQYLRSKGFKKKGSNLWHRVDQKETLVHFRRKISNHALSTTVSAGRPGGVWGKKKDGGSFWGTEQIHILIEDQSDRLEYIAATNNLQRWSHREQKLQVMLEMMDRWVFSRLLV